MTIFDVGIIGAGVAGAFATLRIAKEHKEAKTILFDLGRPPQKRRRQLEGWLGCLPNSDGKLYLSNLEQLSEIVGVRRSKSSYNWFHKVISNVDNFKVTKDKGPSVSLDKRLKKVGYDISLNDYIQLYPKDVHALSKYMSDIVSESSHITCSFDNEIKKVYKTKNTFTICTDEQEYRCKKLIIAVGRSGWRWVKELFTNFGIVDNNDTAKFGIRIEMSASSLKDFNKSSCTISKGDVQIGPFSWFGTVIPEDHVDVAISAFRSNENRWKTDKVSFNLIGDRYFPNAGFEQTDRISKLTFVLSNDRIVKERVSHILAGKSKISIIPEYDWIKTDLEELNAVIPEISTKAYFHVPTIMPLAPKINLGTNLCSEIDDMFVVGESAGLHGILNAACTGIISADMACK